MTEIILTDSEVALLIRQPKRFAGSENDLFNMKTKRGHREGEAILNNDDGSRYRILIRQNIVNQLDFSVILAYSPPKTNTEFRLRRYNGQSHIHSNKIENSTTSGFHIHEVTERYQKAGFKPEGYAYGTSEYSDIRGALKCLISDCSIEFELDNQISLL